MSEIVHKGAWDLATTVISKVMIRITLLRVLITPIIRMTPLRVVIN